MLGDPLCPDCFDYLGAVLWNAHLPRLWLRTALNLYLEVGRAAGLSDRQVRSVVRLSYIKVVEFQRRGLVHVHLVLRADGRAGSEEAPPPWLRRWCPQRCRTPVNRPGRGARPGAWPGPSWLGPHGVPSTT